MQQTITAIIRQRVVTVTQIEQPRDVDIADLITLTDAAELLNKDISAISRWVGQELPEITIPTTKRRYTLKSAVLSMKEDIEKIRSTGLPLLSSEPLDPAPDVPAPKNEISD